MTAKKKQPVVELDRDWLTLDEAANYMRCNKVTVMKHIRKGGIQARQPFGPTGKWLVKTASIEKFMESGGRY